MTETPILDERAISEIEKRIDSFPLSPLQARALCATVKHLRKAERERNSLSAAVETLIKQRGDLQSRLAQVEQERDTARESVTFITAEKQKVEQERDRLLRGDFTDEELQGFCHNLSEQYRQAFFEGCTRYQERLFGTSAIAQLKGEAMRIGPTHCSECGNDYGHYDHCSKSSTRPENWPLSRRLKELATSATPDNERLQVLISLTAVLAAKVEKL